MGCRGLSCGAKAGGQLPICAALQAGFGDQAGTLWGTDAGLVLCHPCGGLFAVAWQSCTGSKQMIR